MNESRELKNAEQLEELLLLTEEIEYLVSLIKFCYLLHKCFQSH